MKAFIAITVGIFAIATGCNRAPEGSSSSVASSNDRMTATDQPGAPVNDQIQRSEQTGGDSKTTTQDGKPGVINGAEPSQRRTVQKLSSGAEAAASRDQANNVAKGARGSLISPPTLAAGTSFTVQSDSTGFVRQDQRPDTIVASVMADVKDSIGRIVIPAGAKVKMALVNLIEARPDSVKVPIMVVYRAFEIIIQERVYPIIATSSNVDTTGAGRRQGDMPLVRLSGPGRSGPSVRDEAPVALFVLRVVLTLDRPFSRY